MHYPRSNAVDSWLASAVFTVAAFFATGALAAPVATAVPTFRVSVAAASTPLKLVIYGDMRFTDPRNTTASNPAARRALVKKIATDHPLAVFMDGDIPYHGGNPADYAVFRRETGAWRAAGIREYPVMGNHEYEHCQPLQCRRNWWRTFPVLKGRQWYSVQLGQRLYAIGLDSDSSLLPGSVQYRWFVQQIEAIPRSIPFVLIWMHHPPIADPERNAKAGESPRPNEQAIATYLDHYAPVSGKRFLVVSGHIHNYERFERNGVAYVVSGGGGASPDRVARSKADFFGSGSFPNYHYLNVSVTPEKLSVRMIRYQAGSTATRWQTRDRFLLAATPAAPRSINGVQPP